MRIGTTVGRLSTRTGHRVVQRDAPGETSPRVAGRRHDAADERARCRAVRRVERRAGAVGEIAWVIPGSIAVIATSALRGGGGWRPSASSTAPPAAAITARAPVSAGTGRRPRRSRPRCLTSYRPRARPRSAPGGSACSPCPLACPGGEAGGAVKGAGDSVRWGATTGARRPTALSRARSGRCPRVALRSGRDAWDDGSVCPVADWSVPRPRPEAPRRPRAGAAACGRAGVESEVRTARFGAAVAALSTFAAAGAFADALVGVCASGAEVRGRLACVRRGRVEVRRWRAAGLRSAIWPLVARARVSRADADWPASTDSAPMACGPGAIGRRFGRGTSASVRTPAVWSRVGAAPSAAVSNAASAAMPAIAMAAVIDTPEAMEAKSGRALEGSIGRGSRRGGDRIARCIGSCARTFSAVSRLVAATTLAGLPPTGAGLDDAPRRVSRRGAQARPS